MGKKEDLEAAGVKAIQMENNPPAPTEEELRKAREAVRKTGAFLAQYFKARDFKDEDSYKHIPTDKKIAILLENQRRLSLGISPRLSTKQVRLLLYSVPIEEKDSFNKIVGGVNRIIEKRTFFYYMQARLQYMASHVNGLLMTLDTYKKDLYILKELLEERQDKRIEERLKTMEKEASLKIGYEIKSGENGIEISERLRKYIVGITEGTFYKQLKQAKQVTEDLEAFAVSRGIAALIPDDIQDITDYFKSDFERLDLYDGSIISLITGRETLYPRYEEVETGERKNVFAE